MVHFTDVEIESSATIDRFLHLAVDFTVSTSPSTQVEKESREQSLCFDIQVLVQFLHKYECTPLIRLLQMSLSSKIGDGAVKPMTGFILGSIADSVPICVLSLEAAASSCNRQGGSFDHEKGTVCELDPGAVPLAMWKLLSPTTAWAFSKAWSQSTRYGPCSLHNHVSRDLNSIAPAFSRLAGGDN